jgi:hypothetical protein
LQTDESSWEEGPWPSFRFYVDGEQGKSKMQAGKPIGAKNTSSCLWAAQVSLKKEKKEQLEASPKGSSRYVRYGKRI